MHMSKLQSRPSSSATSSDDASVVLHCGPGQPMYHRSSASSSASKWPSLLPESPLLHVRKPMATYGIEFPPVSYVVHFLGVAVIALTLGWVIAFRNGLNLFSSDADLVFNAHPVIQIGGFIFIYAEAILVYKTLSGDKKFKKLVHLIMQAIAFVFVLVGVWAAYRNHLMNNIDNFYSLHSWLGITTVILFFIQWVVGFTSFWTQSISASGRAAVLPWHVFFGLFIFVLATATATTGYLEKITFLNINAGLGHYASEVLYVNSTALVLVLFGVVTILAAIIPAPKEDGYQPIS
ncbi:unnamed protein product [Calypogeia fissa]